MRKKLDATRADNPGCGRGSYALMLKNFTGADHIYIACGYTDMRKGIDGLAASVRNVFGVSPFSNSLFLFCGRRKDRIKALYFEGDGFVLLYKRIERGRFQWPRTREEARELNVSEFHRLMRGLSIEERRTIQDCGEILL